MGLVGGLKWDLVGKGTQITGVTTEAREHKSLLLLSFYRQLKVRVRMNT